MVNGRNPPDLSNTKARSAYRDELNRVAIVPRLGGLLALVAGLLFQFMPVLDAPYLAGFRTEKIGWVLLISGWLMLLAAIVARSAYHAHRMRRD